MEDFAANYNSPAERGARMLTDYRKPTVAELAHGTGLDQTTVRKVVHALQDKGVVLVEEPGDMISPALQPGLSTSATPTTIKPDVAPDFNLPHTHDKEKG